MVYQGKPSSGCRNCRQRRIKCDETRPHCRACIRTKRTCPGYPDPFDLVHRDHSSSFRKTAETSPASESCKSSTNDEYTPSLASSKALSISDGHTSSHPGSKTISPAKSTRPQSSWPPPLGPADLYQSMEETVVPLWFNTFLYLPQDPTFRSGFMEILPGMYSRAERGSHLHLSTLAVGFFSLAAWTGQGSLLRASEQYFIRALPKIREALQSGGGSDVNTTLVSIILLSLYEEMVATKDSEFPMRAHLRGAIALINEKDSTPIEQMPSQHVLRTIEAQIIKNSRSFSNPMIPTPSVWPLPHARGPSPKVVLSSIAAETVRLRQSWERILNQPQDKAKIESILRKAIEIDINLVSWTYWLPEHWLPTTATMIPEAVREAGMYHNCCDCYANMWIAVTWNTFRDCRILVQRIMLRCLSMAHSLDPDGRRAISITQTIHKLADDVCASVPYLLGSQVESVRMKPGLVTYPWSETRPVTQTHLMSAPLMGPWHLFPFMRNLCDLDLGLPPVQYRWIQDQINRCMVIYFQR